MGKKEILERAKEFLYRHARLLDRKRFEFHFEGGSNECVMDALRAYQNIDGGFGNALEPDIRCPQSQPVPTEMALGIMAEIGAWDQRVMGYVAQYLDSITLPDGGVPFVFRSASLYPHAPWWKTEADDVPSLNPTGNLIGLLYKLKAGGEITEADWFVKNVSYIWRCLEEGELPEGYHDGVQWITFLEHTPERERAKRVQAKLDDWLSRPGVIERDPHAEGYVHKVLDWCPAPDSYARRFVTDQEVEKHLDHLLKEQQEDGGWPIHFPAVSSAGEAEWRGWLTVERLKTLRAYGVI